MDRSQVIYKLKEISDNIKMGGCPVPIDIQNLKNMYSDIRSEQSGQSDATYDNLLYEIIDNCTKSSDLNLLIPSIELAAIYITHGTSTWDNLKKDVFERLIAFCRDYKNKERYVITDAAYSALMLIARDLPKDNLKKFISVSTKAIRDDYRNPFLDEFLNEIDIVASHANIEYKAHYQTEGHKAPILSVHSRKGGPGKTTILISMLLSLHDIFGPEKTPKIAVFDLDNSGPAWIALSSLFIKKQNGGNAAKSGFLDNIIVEYSNNFRPDIMSEYCNKISINLGSAQNKLVNYDLYSLSYWHASLHKLSREFEVHRDLVLSNIYNILEWAQKEYDYVLIDAPPGLFRNVSSSIFYLSYRFDNWYRYIVSTNFLPDLVGVIYELDAFWLGVSINDKLIKPSRFVTRDIWIINQLPLKLLHEICESATNKIKNSFFDNFSDKLSEWAVGNYLPDQGHLWRRLAKSLPEYGLLSFGLPYDKAIHEKTYKINSGSLEMMTFNNTPMSLNVIKNSRFFDLVRSTLILSMFGRWINADK